MLRCAALMALMACSEAALTVAQRQLALATAGASGAEPGEVRALPSKAGRWKTCDRSFVSCKRGRLCARFQAPSGLTQATMRVPGPRGCCVQPQRSLCDTSFSALQNAKILLRSR